MCACDNIMTGPSAASVWTCEPCVLTLLIVESSACQSRTLQESMRKRPVLPLMFRRAVKDVRIGPYLFPAGTIIEVHVLAMNTRPLYWDQPDDFLPVRSSPPIHAHALPFRIKRLLWD